MGLAVFFFNVVLRGTHLFKKRQTHFLKIPIIIIIISVIIRPNPGFKIWSYCQYVNSPIETLKAVLPRESAIRSCGCVRLQNQIINIVFAL